MANFTIQRFRKLLLQVSGVFICLSFGLTLRGQDNYTVRVTAPVSIVGNYPALIASFGPTIDPCSISGELVRITDGTGGTLGCDTILTNLTGRIAVIDRGSCTFTTKVFRAQQKGAIAVIIVNNAATDIFSMPAGAGDVFAPQIRIPSFMISLADGNLIKAQLANGVTVNITQNPAPFPTGEVVLWGNQPGQGDFNGGLNGWTSRTFTCNGAASTVNVFNWRADGSARGSCSVGAIYSPTRCNGAVAVESDFIDNAGSGCGGTAVGTGPCPAPQIAELTSPEITLTPESADVNVRFFQHFRQFRTQFLLAWTTNGGTTWDTTRINENVTLDNGGFSSVSEITRVRLRGTAGATRLQIKFIVIANYYYWILDDVQIVKTAANNLRVNDFYAVPYNAVTPLAHVEPIGFLADIENIGAATQTNVKLNMTIRYRQNANQQFTPVFTSDLNYGTVPAGALIENIPFAQTFRPTAVGQYTGTYTISADSTDAVPDNNTQQFQFLVSDANNFNNLFSKDLTGPINATRPADAGWEANEPNGWAWGVSYYVPRGAGNFIKDVSFAIQPADNGARGKDVIVFVYKWRDANRDELAQPNERDAVGFAAYTITGNERFNSLITLPVSGIAEDFVRLQDSTHYIVMVEYLATDKSNLFISYNDEIDYAAAKLLSDSLRSPRYPVFLGVAGNLAQETYVPFSFRDVTYSFIPVVRMSVTNSPSSANDLKKLSNQFEVFPNPTVSGTINLQFSLEKTAKNATLRLYDLSGRMLRQWQYNNLQQERFQYQLSGLSSGTYFLQLVTEEGAGIKKIVVQ